MDSLFSTVWEAILDSRQVKCWVVALAILSFFAQSVNAKVWQISNKADLLAIKDHPERYGDSFHMTADIDLSGEVFTEALIAADGGFGD